MADTIPSFEDLIKLIDLSKLDTETARRKALEKLYPELSEWEFNPEYTYQGRTSYRASHPDIETYKWIEDIGLGRYSKTPDFYGYGLTKVTPFMQNILQPFYNLFPTKEDFINKFSSWYYQQYQAQKPTLTGTRTVSPRRRAYIEYLRRSVY